MADIKRVCVIGSGVMGAGIAAQVANAGVPVLLLDIVPKEGANRNAIAEGAVTRMLKTDPAPFMGKAAAKLVETGNIDDHLDRIADCDWIIEVVVERLDVKQALYAWIEEKRRDGSVVSSNTSTIPLADLVAGLPERFQRDFIITHFFNPPRYMRLLEIVAGPLSDPAAVKRVADFADVKLGKAVVDAKDSPGFIANRIGTLWMQAAVNAAFDLGLTVEEADAIGGRPMGVPKTGIFGLIDLVGLDLMPHIHASLKKSLPESDPFHATLTPRPLIERMIATGFTGRKGKGGFYRINREAGKRKEALDLVSGEYRVVEQATLPTGKGAKGDLKALVTEPGKTGDYAWAVLGPTLAYSAALVGEVADDIVAIDRAMTLGYNWKSGPFAMIDALGAKWLAERYRAEGTPVPTLLDAVGDGSFYRIEGGRRQYFGTDGAYHDVTTPAGVLLLDDIKRAAPPLFRNESAGAWDIGDGVVAFEFTTKMNAIDPLTIAAIDAVIPIVTDRFKALVIYNDGANFSAGANLGLAMMGASMGAYDQIADMIAGGQKSFKALKYAPFPVVAAPAGLALGGGCEIVLHADAVQAHAETYIGLVEGGVGLVPGWGGNGELLDRWQKAPGMPKGPMPAVAKTFETISTATVAKSAAEAKALMLLRATDGITMNRERLLADAKARALAMVDGYAPPEPPTYRLPGAAGRTGLNLAVAGMHKRGLATDYDLVVGDAMATVLSGGEADLIDTVDEDALLALERTAFMDLMRRPETLKRIEHMLTTGKPLRN